ncbi:MAG: phosphoribosyl-ATP diphosphatase [Ruminococcus sp.]|nr:phosphoribosyl-ATP diphosphatase [Ruminococcus sp.]
MADQEKLVLTNLYRTIENRRDNPIENSYTCYLLDKGIDKILKKVGEECAETIIAAKNGDHVETIYEIADLLYHLTVMMVDQGIPLEEVLSEIADRSKKTQNLKPIHQVDKNS